MPTPQDVVPKSFVLDKHKIAFVSVAKNACTSFKWLMADLSGQDPERFYETIRPNPTQRQAIHNRALWEGVPRLHDLGRRQRARISPDNGWFVFAIVRDPRLRVWSAWQSKFLVRNPIWAQYVDEPWAPRVPTGVEDVVEDFATFVRYLRDNPKNPVIRDNHFAPQTKILHEDIVTYSRLYDISQIPALMDDLTTHLRTVGIDTVPSLGRENDTPLGVRAEVFGDGVRAAIESIYAADLERFGDRWDFDQALSKQSEWSDAAFRDIAMRVTLHQRIGDLSRAARRATRRGNRLEERIAELEQLVDE